MQKRAVHMIIPAALGAGSFAWKSGIKNLAEYMGMMNLDKLRGFIGGQGSALVRAGFRDGLRGKRVPRYGPTGLGAGLLAGAAPMSMYEQGLEFGKRVVGVSRSSGVDPQSLLRGVQKADKLTQGAIATAPYTGAGIGAARGLLQERHNKPEERHYTRAAAGGAAKGAVLGIGAKHFLPHAAGIRHLHDLRTGQVDTLLGQGKSKNIEKLFDMAARPEVAAAKKRNIASEAFEAGMHGQPLKGRLFSGTKRRARREGQAAGKAFSENVDKIPFVSTDQARAALPKIDDFLRKTLRRAPIIGAGAGAAADVNSERHKKPEKRSYARAAGVGALKGGDLGAAVGHFAPHTKAVKGLHEYREKFFG